MTPIIWLCCLAVLWSIVADPQADEVDPLVLAVYSRKYGEQRITFTDLTDAKNKNFTLLDDAEPKYFVLLCVRTDNNLERYSHLIVQRLTREIKSEANEMKCEYHPLPYIRNRSVYNKLIMYDIGYFVDMELLKKENPNYRSDELLNEFIGEFNLSFWRDLIMEYIDIQYHMENKIPVKIIHTVRAHMHSDIHEKECEEIKLNTFTEKSKEYRLDTLHEIKVPGYKWRQFVPMQDFKGIYAAEATCIYINYLLLHEKAILSLEKVENFIRDVADVINEVRVESGTYSPNDVLFVGSETNKTIIPSIVWKKIIHRGDSVNEYAVLVIIHNRITKKICEHNEDLEKLGLPTWDEEKNENKIGYMYYCFLDRNIIHRLHVHSHEVENTLTLRNLPFKKGEEQKTIDVISKIKENKQAEKHSC